MKAIETVYKGIRFRSRLEARWAVFFDAAGIEWKYENEGYEKFFYKDQEKDGKWVDVVDHVTRYLPDFWLPGTNTFAEVKGCDEALRNDMGRLEEILDWGSPIPGIDDSLETNRGLLLLGDIPDVSGGRVPLHPIIQHSKGLYRSWATFMERGACVMRDNKHYAQYTVGSLYSVHSEVLESDMWSLNPKVMQGAGMYKPLWEAYPAARQARFEHGQTPYLVRRFA